MARAVPDLCVSIYRDLWLEGVAFRPCFTTPTFTTFVTLTVGVIAAPARRTVCGMLTEREIEVLDCLGEGLSNAKIAERLCLSEAAIKGYVSRTLDKPRCANRTQAGLVAYDAGLVTR